MANIQDTITRLPVHARHIGVGAVAAGAHRVCVHTKEEQRGGRRQGFCQDNRDRKHGSFFVRSIFAGTTFSNGVAGHAICYTPNLFALITGSLANTCGAQMHGVPTRPWRKADWVTF